MWPLLLLAFGSIFVGYLGKELILSNTLSPIISNSVKIVPLLLSILGALLAFVVYDRNLRGPLRYLKEFLLGIDINSFSMKSYPNLFKGNLKG